MVSIRKAILAAFSAAFVALAGTAATNTTSAQQPPQAGRALAFDWIDQTTLLPKREFVHPFFLERYTELNKEIRALSPADQETFRNTAIALYHQDPLPKAWATLINKYIQFSLSNAISISEGLVVTREAMFVSRVLKLPTTPDAALEGSAKLIRSGILPMLDPSQVNFSTIGGIFVRTAGKPCLEPLPDGTAKHHCELRLPFDVDQGIANRIEWFIRNFNEKGGTFQGTLMNTEAGQKYLCIFDNPHSPEPMAPDVRRKQGPGFRIFNSWQTDGRQHLGHCFLEPKQ
jgi:hypothetical protein